MTFLSSLLDDEPDRSPAVLRGGDKLTAAAARDYARKYDVPLVGILGVPVPEPLLYRGVTLQGGQGTGKTLTILTVLMGVLRELAVPGNKRKLIIMDVKGELASIVLGLMRVVCPGVPLHLLNPFELFGSALDPHEFADEPTRILQTVHALTRRGRDARSDEFFDSSARGHLADLVKVLKSRADKKWGWRTLLLIACSYDLLARVLKNSRVGRPKGEKIVKKTFAGVVSTIESWLDWYSAAFACWDKSPTFSIEQFLRSSGVIILSVPEDQVESVGPIARLVLRKVKDRLLADTGRDPASRTTLVFDEYADFEGVADIIYPFFGRSRSANCSVITAWQSWPAVCAAHEELRMKGVLDNAAVRLWFGCGTDSAEVASRYCMAGEARRWEESHAQGREYTRTVSSRTELRTVVLPSEVQALTPPLPGDLRVRGFMTASHLPGPLYCEEDYAPFIKFLNRVPKVPSFRPRPQSDHWLEPWDHVVDGAALDALFKKEK